MESKSELKSDKFTYEYSKNDVLGEGAWGKVTKAIRKEDGLQVAIKLISQETFKKKSIGNILDRLFHNEMKYVTKITSPHVIKIIEYFNDEQYRYQVLELINGKTLQEYFEGLPYYRLDEAKVIEIMKQILKGFRAIHEQNIIHRDLKLENIMYHTAKDGQQVIKIIDFGFCKALDEKTNITKTNLGNDSTKAPEVYKGAYGLGADLYGLGCILYEMLYGDLLFESLEEKKYKVWEWKPEVKVSQEMKDLIIKMVKYDPDERITFKELYNTRIFKEQHVSKIYDDAPQSFGSSSQDNVLQLYDLIRYLLDAINSADKTFEDQVNKQVQNEAFWMMYKLVANKAQKLLKVVQEQQNFESTKIINELSEQLQMDLILGSSKLKEPWKVMIKENSIKENTKLKEPAFQDEVKDYNKIHNEEKFNQYYSSCTDAYYQQLKSLKLTSNMAYLQHVLRVKNCLNPDKLLSFEFRVYNGEYHKEKIQVNALKSELAEIFN